jgi:hypothetical protein
MNDTCIAAAEEAGLTEEEAIDCKGEFKCPNCPYRTENLNLNAIIIL